MFYDIMNILIVIFIAIGCFSYYKLSTNTGEASMSWISVLVFGWGGAVILAVFEGLVYLIEQYI